VEASQTSMSVSERTNESLSAFKEFVSTWDSSALREANEKLGTVLPDLKTTLSKGMAGQTEQVSNAVQTISEMVESTQAMVSGTAAILVSMEDLMRHLVPVSASPHPVHAHINGAGLELGAVVGELRALRSDLANQIRQPITFSESDGTRTIINPIPQQALANLADMSSALDRIRQDITSLRNIQQEQIRRSEERQIANLARKWVQKLVKR
jgi:hypothetical protein